jgi:hypothetical protein
MGRWQIHAFRNAGIFALLAMATAVTGREAAAQAQQPLKPPAAVQAAEPTNLVKPKPSAEEFARWRQTIAHTPPPEKTCFTAKYPATTWTKVPCGTPANVAHLPAMRPGSVKLGGNAPAGDNILTAAGLISWAEGSFDAVINVNSACSVGCSNSICPTNPSCADKQKNNYSIQLNTNPFVSAKACNGCFVWEQFVFSNRGCVPPQPPPGSSPPNIQQWEAYWSKYTACASIQYWLMFEPDGVTPYTNCPSGWHQNHPGCYINSNNSVPLIPFLVDDLGSMRLRGSVAGASPVGNTDSLIFTYGADMYWLPGDNRLPELGREWVQAEFNVFGLENGEEVVFNSGSTLVVRIVADSGTTSAPTCAVESLSQESNNLEPTALSTIPVSSNGGPAFGVEPTNPQGTPVATMPNSQQSGVFGGPWANGPGPALVFAETNDPNAKPVNICQDVLTVPGVRPVIFEKGGH